jgi:hypothetical protein
MKVAKPFYIQVLIDVTGMCARDPAVESDLDDPLNLTPFNVNGT